VIILFTITLQVKYDCFVFGVIYSPHLRT